MIISIKQSIKSFLGKDKSREIPIHWINKEEDSWLSQILSRDFIKPHKSAYSRKIETIAKHTNNQGAQPLWEGYGTNNSGGQTRMPAQVRTTAAIGDLYTYLVQERKPKIIVEFGTAFGVSGMYFLAGIDAIDEGKLLTFDPNDVWAKEAEKNLSQISDRFDLTIGTFEENIDNVLSQDQTIDLAFIDAIHTKEFVLPQLDMVVARSCNGAIIILDDINFSDSMRKCWNEISTNSRFAASVALGDRVGILELKRT